MSFMLINQINFLSFSVSASFKSPSKSCHCVKQRNEVKLMPTIQIRLLMDPEKKSIEITDDQCKTIQNNVSYLQETLSEIDYCLMLRENISAAFEDFETNGAGIPNNFIRLNRFLMNWLNSFYAWIEYHEKHYKDLFSALKTKYYDSYFPYRFAYAMRSYTTHQSLCISRITFDVINETTKYVIPINEILIQGKELNKKFKQELEQIMTEHDSIDLTDFSKGFLSMFESLQSEIWQNIISLSDQKHDEIIRIIKPYEGTFITGFYVEKDGTKIIDVAVTLSRYREKRKELSLPEALKQYL